VGLLLEKTPKRRKLKDRKSLFDLEGGEKKRANFPESRKAKDNLTTLFGNIHKR